MMYRTQCEAIRNLPPEQFKAVVCALWDYEMDGVEPEGDPIVMAMFGMAKPLIDRRNTNYENGKKGGRPKTETKPNDNRTITEPEPNPNLKVKGERIKVKGERIKDIGEKIKDKEKENILSDCKAIIDYLNDKAGTAYRHSSKDTQSHIRARLADGFTVQDFRTVIDKKVDEWKGSEMEKYLRPSTLFGTKFEGYLNQKTTKKDRFSDVDEWLQQSRKGIL